MSDQWTSPSGESGEPQQPAASPDGQSAPPTYGQGYPPAPPTYGQGYPPGPYAGGGPGWSVMAPRPGVIPLRPLRLGDIFEGAMRTIRGNPGATLGLSFVVSALFTLPAILLIVGLAQVDPGDNDGLREAVSLLNQQGATLLQSLGGIALTGMLTVVLADAVLGRRMSIGMAWSRVKGRLLALIGLNLLFVLVAVVAVALVVGVAFVAGMAIGVNVGFAFGVFGVLGALLLAIFCWVKVMFASACVVLERQSPVAGIRRSWALTRGQWWRIFGISLLAYLLVGVIASVATAPLTVVVGLDVASDPEALPSIGTLIALQLTSLVINTLTAPFLAGVAGLLYLDQRIRKEALDVTLIAATQQTG